MRKKVFKCVAGGFGILMTIVTWTTCRSFFPSPVPSASNNLSRDPSSLSDVVLGGASLLGQGLFSGASSITNFTIEAVKPMIIRNKLYGLLDSLPLEPEVRKRVYQRIESEKLMMQIVPFLFSLKDLYMASPTLSNQNFANHIKKVFSSDAYPGLEHSLFTYKESDGHDGMGFPMDQEILTKVINLYDVIFLQGDDYQLGMLPTRDMKVVERTMPVLKGFLETIMNKMGGGEAIGEVLEGLKGMMEDPYRMETLTVSLIDFISQMVNRHHQMFSEKVNRIQIRKKWFQEELAKESEGTLWTYLQKAQMPKRRVVHIVVDGLQGQLMESLVKGDPQDLFLQKIYQDHVNSDKYRPETEMAKQAPDQSIHFLSHLNQQKFNHPHYLPFFRHLYQNNSSGIVQRGISTTPTISVRNIPVAITGAPVAGPGSTGLPNFHFIERSQDRAYYFYGNDSLLMEPMSYDSGMKNPFDRFSHLDGLNCHAPFGRGARTFLDGFINLALGERIRDFSDILCLGELEKRAKNEIEARKIRQELLDLQGILTSTSWLDALGKLIQSKRAGVLLDQLAALEEEGIPDYFLYYNPWPDHFAHFKGPFSDEIISPTGELNRLDYWLGRIQKTYQTAQVEKSTLFGMAGDHGLAPIYYMLNPEVNIFERLSMERGVQFKIKKISSDEGEGPKMTHPLKPPSMKDYDVVVASTAGGNYMMDLFIDQGENWAKQPLEEDLLVWKTLESDEINIVDAILESLSETLEYMVLRETPCNPQGGTVKLWSILDGEKVSARIVRQKGKIFYDSPEDLLQVATLSPYFHLSEQQLELHRKLLEKCYHLPQEDNPSNWCSEEEWRQLTSVTSKPDSVVQLSHLYDHDRAGTINLFPKEGIGYNTKVPGRHAGEHFHEKDSFVGWWGQGLQTQQRILTAPIGSVPVTLYEYLSGKKTIMGTEEGWGYPSFIKEILPQHEFSSDN